MTEQTETATSEQSEVMIDDMELSEREQELLQATRNAVQDFLESDEEVLPFEPMSSFHRRIVHKVGTHYKLHSRSLGEGDDRYVCLLKSPDAKISENPRRKPHESPEALRVDYGMDTFNAKPGTQVVLRKDGSFGVPMREKELEILDRRIITNGLFRIRKGRLVCNQDQGW
tara:strand:- start:273 stop:785 length:513 start_codon:yes stop_codon:yes gene_type:complete